MGRRLHKQPLKITQMSLIGMTWGLSGFRKMSRLNVTSRRSKIGARMHHENEINSNHGEVTKMKRRITKTVMVPTIKVSHTVLHRRREP